MGPVGRGAQCVTWCHLLSKQGHPRAQCTVLQPDSSGLSLCCWTHSPAFALDEIYRQPHLMLKWDSACRETTLCLLIFWVHNLGTLLFSPFDCS